MRNQDCEVGSTPAPRSLQTFCAAALPEHVPALQEMERALDREFDYLLEARNLALLRERVLPAYAAGRRAW